MSESFWFHSTILHLWIIFPKYNIILWWSEFNFSLTSQIPIENWRAGLIWGLGETLGDPDESGLVVHFL